MAPVYSRQWPLPRMMDTRHLRAHVQATEQASLRKEHAGALEEVEQWCQGEVEAVRHMAGKQLERAAAEVEQW